MPIDLSVLGESSDSALWFKNAIIYEVHIRAFFDSDGDGIGDFQGLIEKLDYLVDLGVTAIWILPFYPSPLRDGGYDIADYTDINPSYGKREDFAKLMHEAHARGLKVITELVLNHTSSEHAWFKRARRAPKGSPEREFYVWSDTPNPYSDARIIFKDFETSNWSWDPVAKQYYWHRFYSHQPDLNFDNPAVHQALFDVVDYWLDLGVDGMRLDAVPYLYEREGTSCENLAETHVFLRSLRAHIDSKYQNRMLLAEANQWPEDAAAYFGNDDECHMNFHFPLMPRMFMAVQLEDRFPIVNILRQTPVIPSGCQWATFLRNHDELTLEMVTDEDRDYMYRVYADELTSRINLGIRRRLAPLLRMRRKIELLNALLFSLPGTPVLYYGDEIGMGDNIYLGDRDGVRTPMQWSGDRNAGFSRANPQRLYLPVIIDPEFHFESINVEAQQNNPSSLLWWMKRIIGLRKRHRVFGRGSLEFLEPRNARVLAFIRALEQEQEQVLVVANLSRFGQYVELDLSRYEGLVPVEMFGQTRFPRIVAGKPYVLTLGPHDFFWFDLQKPASIGARAERSVPTLAARGSWLSLLEGDGRKALEKVAIDFVVSSGWYQGRSRTRTGASLRDVIPLATGTSGEPCPYRVLLVHVEYSEGDPENYMVPVAYLAGATAEELERSMPHTLLCRLAVVGQTPAGNGSPDVEMGVLHDALATPGFTRCMLDMFVTKGRSSSRQGSLQAIPEPLFEQLRGSEELLPMPKETEDVTPSIACSNRVLVKYFRLVSEGIHPEVEVGKYLSSRSELHASPRHAGTFQYQARGRRESTVLAMLQEYRVNEGDAFKYALDALDAFFERVLSDSALIHVQPEMPTGPRFARAEQHPSESTGLVIGSYLGRVARLGQRLGELHLALSAPGDDPAFTPEVFTFMYQQSIYQAAHNHLMRNFSRLRDVLEFVPELEVEPASIRTLSASPSLPSNVRLHDDERTSPIHPRELAKAILGRQREIDQRLRSVVSHKIDAVRIRCHGYLHLGQILRSGDDFVMVNFGGEQTRALGERRFKRSPLRDVAGMLRSFEYAELTALYRGRLRPEDVTLLSAWGRMWTEWVQATFLRAWLVAVSGGDEQRAFSAPPFLPTAAADRELLLHFYLLEKAVMEVGYDLEHRRERLAVPLTGVQRLLET